MGVNYLDLSLTIYIFQRNTEKQRPTVVTRGIEGRIKWFNIPRGYGFIERLDEQPDVFVHQSAVVRPGRKPRFSLFLKGGEQVEFDVVEGIFMNNPHFLNMNLGLKGLEAAAVTAPGGYELPTIAMKGGNHHRRDFKHRNRNFRRRDRRHNNGNESSENEKVFLFVKSSQKVKLTFRMKVAITKQK